MHYTYIHDEEKFYIKYENPEERDKNNERTIWRGVELNIEDQFWYLDANSTIDIEKFEDLYELKSCMREYKSGRAGSFCFLRHQHRKLVEEGGHYILVLRSPVSDMEVKIHDCVYVPAQDIDQLLIGSSRSWVYQNSYKMTIPWTKIPHVDTRKSKTTLTPE